MKKNFIYILLSIYAVLLALSILYFKGTGDGGDSVLHYLFAKWAPVHPELYFDHWAKPLFVLLASPFAQFGINGIKVFNSIMALSTIFITYKIACELNLKNSLVVALFMIFSPLFYILTLSGLTEPLFGAFIAFGVYLCIKQNYKSACILISFLPFVRSEGLIIIGVFGIYLLFKKTWKFLPLLATGSIIYSIAGYFVYHDFLWVFTRIPYANLGSIYGSGPLSHFAEQLINVTGIPSYILFWIGLIKMLYDAIRHKIEPETHILVLLGFLCFFIAHSLFWYLGIFNSMGLKRVLIGVMPLIAIIALQGFNVVSTAVFSKSKTVRNLVPGLILAYVVIFPFTANPSAIHWEKDLVLGNDQVLATEVATFIMNKGETHYPLLYNQHCLSEALNIDEFDKTIKQKLTLSNIANMKTGDLLIWDSWLSRMEPGIKPEELDNNPGLARLKSFMGEENGAPAGYVIYEKKE